MTYRVVDEVRLSFVFPQRSRRLPRSLTVEGRETRGHMAGPEPIQNHLVGGLTGGRVAVQATTRRFAESSGRDLGRQNSHFVPSPEVAGERLAPLMAAWAMRGRRARRAKTPTC